MPLEFQQKHIMTIINRDKKDGWTIVSDELYPVLLKLMPSELVEFSGINGCYKARLTEEGNNVLNAMKWL